MKLPNFTKKTGGVSLRLLLLGIALAFLPLVLMAQAPTWWSQRGVTNSNPANDYAAVNQGQVKNIAMKAVDEFNEKLAIVGGAGDALNQLALRLSATTAQTNDYTAVNLGQLKAVAKPFHDRLIEVGYATSYPWVGKEASANDYAMANIGQVKNLFCFGLQMPSAPQLIIISGTNQTGAPGTIAASPLTALLIDGATGLPLSKTSVTFTVTGNYANLSNSATGGPFYSSINLLTDNNGIARLDGGGQVQSLYVQYAADGATIEVQISAGSASTSVVFTSTVANGAPVITTSSLSAIVGQSFSQTIQATGSSTNYGVSGLPIGMSLDSASGRITGTPTTAGAYPLTLTATNIYGTGQTIVTLIVAAGAPVITSPLAVSVAKGQLFEYVLKADYAPQTLTVSGLPSQLSFDQSSALVSGTFTQEGTYTFSIQATNSQGLDTKTVIITVGIDLPQIQSATEVDATLNQPFTFQISATNAPQSYTALGLPAGLTIDPATGLLSGTPTELGSSLVTIGVANASGTTNGYLRIQVNPLGVPVLSLPGKIYLTKDQTFTYQIQSTGNLTQYQATGLPSGLTINGTTGVISGTPTEVSTPEAEITVTNPAGFSNGKLLFIVMSSTRNANAVMKFQEGASPSPDYHSDSAGLAQDSGNATLADGKVSAMYIGAIPGTQIWRVLLGFDLEELPPDANISSASLQIHGTARGSVPPIIDLLSVAGSFDWGQITWNSAASLTTGTINSVTPSLTGTALDLSFLSNPGFVENVSSVFASSDKEVKLQLKATAAEMIASDLRPRSFYLCDKVAPNASDRPKLELGYVTGAPPELHLPDEWVIQQGVTVTPLDLYAVHAPIAFSAVNLPAGLVINSNTGQISGTPTTPSSSVTEITSTNANGSGKRKLTIRVIPPPPVITSPLTWTFVSGTQAQYAITATNNPTHFSASDIPYGFTLDEGTGLISGTASGPGTYNMSVGAQNETGSSQATVAVTVQPTVPQITSSGSASASVGVNFSYYINATQTPVTYSVAGLPSGLSQSANSSYISGIPTQSGTYNAILTVANSAGTTTAPLQIVVGEAPIPTIASFVAEGSINKDFYRYLSIDNSWYATTVAVTGTLPPGLTYSGGNISGTPTQSGTYTFTISATNTYTFADSSTITRADTKISTIIIHPEGPWIYGANYQVNEGSTLPTIYSNGATSITAGTNFPGGLSLVSSGSGWKIQGTVPPGTYNFTLYVSNGVTTNEVPVSLTVNPLPVFTSTLSITATVGSPFSYTLTAENSPTTYQIDADSLPAGLVRANNSITGMPSVPGLYDISVSASNAAGRKDASLQMLVVANPNDASTSFSSNLYPDASYTALIANIRADSSTPSSMTESIQDDGAMTIGRMSNLEVRRMLLEYDLSALPDDIKITSATLTFSPATQSGTGAGTVSVFQAAQAFLNATPNWANNSSYANVMLSSRLLDQSYVNGAVSFYSTPSFVAAVTQSKQQETPLDLVIAAPSIEGRTDTAFFGFLKSTSQPQFNPALKVTYALQAPTAVPEIKPPLQAQGTVTQPFSYHIKASHRPTSYAATNLPSWLSLNAVNGLITGTAPANAAGEYHVTITAINDVGVSAPADLDILVQSNTPVTGLEIVSGDQQIGLVYSTLPVPFVVRAWNGGTKVSGALISFTVGSGNGGFVTGTSTVTSKLLVTDSNGIASVSFQLPGAPGIVTALAKTAGVQVSFVSTAALYIPTSGEVASAVNLRLISGGGQSGPSGQQLSPVVIQALDAFGNPLMGRTVQVSAISGAGTISPTAVITDGLGKANFSVTPQGPEGAVNSFQVKEPDSGAALTFSVAVMSSPGSPNPGGARTTSLDNSAATLGIKFVYAVAQNNDATKAVLSWTGVTGDPAGFRIDRKTEDQDWITVTSSVSGSSYTDKNLKSNRRYQYRVFALSGDRKSAPVYTCYRVPVVKSLDIRDRHAEGFKMCWQQFTPAEKLKFFLTYTENGNGSGSSIASGSTTTWNGDYKSVSTYNPVPNSQTGDIDWNITYSGESSENRFVSRGNEYASELLRSSTRAVDGSWSGSSQYLWANSSTGDSGYINEGWPSYWEPICGHLKSMTATEINRSDELGETTDTLSGEYSTKALIRDVGSALTDYSEWNNQSFGSVCDDYFDTYCNGYNWYYESVNAAVEWSYNECYYGLKISQYYLEFYPSFGGDYKWLEVFIPEESNLTNDTYENGKLYVVHATRTIRPSSQSQSPNYTIDPRERGEKGIYYLAPVSNVLISESAYGVSADEEEKAKGVATTSDIDTSANIGLPNLAIPGSSYKITWTNFSSFKVYAYRYDKEDPEEISYGQEFTDKELADGKYYRFVIVANKNVQPGIDSKLTLTVTHNGTTINESSAKIVYKDNRDYSVPIDEASGSRYRKIALNGLPLPDNKPHQTEESDQEPEESYVDALTLGLRHSTTDVYVKLPGSDLTLSARRDLTSDVWSLRNGLRPQEDPTKPFGVCWSSNLTPSIKFVSSVDNPKPSEPDKAYVIDEGGATHTFVVTYSDFANRTGMQFIPMPTAKNQQTPNLESLFIDNSTVPASYVFKRKYGTTIQYEGTSIKLKTPDDRLAGSTTQQQVTYARARMVTDRLGYELDYDYASTDNLVPRSISVRNHPDMMLSIAQNAQGLITAIWDPNGNKTSFDYVSRSYTSGAGSIWQLAKVTTPDGAVTSYAYDMDSNHTGSDSAEQDLTPHDSMAPTDYHWHCDLASITNPLNQTYQFSYELDHSKLNYKNDPDGTYPGAIGYYTQTGLPRNLKSVKVPGGALTQFQNNSKVWLAAGTGSQAAELVMQGTRQNSVTDASGFARTYTWDDSEVVPVPQVRKTYPDTTSFTDPKLIIYKRMTAHHGNLGSETFEFNLDAAMALSKVTDFSGNATTYQYGDAWSTGASSPFRQALGASSTAFGYYTDPTSQTDALGNTKTFSYTSDNPATGEAGGARLMKSVTDEAGRYTVYGFDSQKLGRRISETVQTSVGGTVVKSTLFDYGNGQFPGFMTTRTVKALAGDASGAVDLVTQYVPDSNGRVAQEIVAPSGLHLVTSYTYDKNGNKTSATDPRGNTTWFSYDSRSRLVTVIYANGTQKQTIYDLAGNKTVEYDENGHATLYQYDSLNRLITQARHMGGNFGMDSASRVTSIPSSDLITANTYNTLNAKTSVTDPRGNVTRMSYDQLQRLVSTTDPGNNITLLEYGTNSGGTAFDSSGFKPTRTIDPRGYATSVTYDALYRPVTKSTQYSIVPAQYSTTQSEYDKVGNVTASVDPCGNRTETDYDALNRPWRVRFGITAPNVGQITPSYGYTQTFFTSTGLKWKVQDENGNVTSTQYDTAGRPVFVISPAVNDGTGVVRSGTTQTLYDAAGNVSATINPLLKRWDFAYDVRNRKTDEFQPAVLNTTSGTVSRPHSHTSYDSVGHITAMVDARGNEMDTYYDPANRVTDVYAPAVPLPQGGTDRPHTATTYDANGNVTQVTDPNGNATQNVYDALNRLVTTTDAAGIQVKYEYDSAGNRTKVTDGNNHSTRFGYDGLKRNITVTDAASHITKFAYDGANKTQRTDALGRVTNYGYDARNWLLSVTYPNRTADNRTYTYDKTGNILSVQEPGKNGIADVAYSYDALRRIATETSGGLTHSYAYDLVGNRVQTVYGGNNLTLTSAYDALNRLSTMVESGRTTSYGYDLSGNIAQKVLPNGDKETAMFDALNRTTSQVAVSGANQPLYSYAYGHDLVGNVTSVGETYPSGLSNRTVTNTYDAINRLQIETVTGSNAATTTHGYDNANNRTSKVVAGGTAAGTTNYVYNALNQLTNYSEGGRNVALTYDAAGNRVTRVGTGGTDAGTDTYSYDFENRLIGLVKGGGQGAGTYAYAYDYRTRRVVRDETQAGGVITKVVFSGGLSIQEYANGSTNASVEYLRGSDYGGGVGGILYTLRGTEASYTHENRRGDVVAKTNSGGALTYQAAYQAYGTRTQENGSTQDRQKANTKDEEEWGGLNEGLRYTSFEGDLRVFLTADPAGFVDGPNLYCYVKQNPWTAFDPEGLNEVVVSGGVNPDTKKDDSHDKYWGNFVQSSKTKITESQRDLKEGEKVEWMVQKSSLVDRAKNEGRKGDYYTSQVEQMAKDMGVDLRWFNTKKEFVQAMNSTTEGEKRSGSSLITSFNYFGHGAESALGLTYVPGRPPDFGEALLSADLPNGRNRATYEKIYGPGSTISPEAFAPGAKATSWACNSATGGSSSLAQAWATSLGMPMSGMVGKADYAPASPQYGTHLWNGTKPPMSPVLGNRDERTWYGAKQQSYWVTDQP